MSGVWVLVILAAAASIAAAHAQEIDYAHYMESIQVVADADLGEASASVVLQSTNTDDIRLPASLERDLSENGRIIAAIFTDAESCILGVGDEACVIVNMARIPEETDIFMVQDGAREVADRFIAPLNAAFGVETEFHSVFLHHSDEQNRALGVPGIVAGYNTISVTYTAPQQGTVQFFDMLVSHLLAPRIADGGGFVDAGRSLAEYQNSTVTFVAVPGTTDTLMMLKVTRDINYAPGGTMDPLDILGIDAVTPSAYFGDGFYPLNSLVRVAVVSQEGRAVSGAEADIIPVSDGKPEDVTGAGWFFDPPEGTLIRGTYLMGQEGVARAGEAAITLGPWNGPPSDGGAPSEDMASGGEDGGAGETPSEDGAAGGGESPETSIEGPIIVAIIVAAGAGAAAFYLKGYRGRPAR